MDILIAIGIGVALVLLSFYVKYKFDKYEIEENNMYD